MAESDKEKINSQIETRKIENKIVDELVSYHLSYDCSYGKTLLYLADYAAGFWLYCNEENDTIANI